MLVYYSPPAVRTRRRPGGKSKGLPEREEKNKEKDCFFTNEASILLKTKAKGFENAQNKLDFKGNLAPKRTPKPLFLPVRSPLSPPAGQITEGYRVFQNRSGRRPEHATGAGTQFNCPGGRGLGIFGTNLRPLVSIGMTRK
jgi:hypothetical protein